MTNIASSIAQTFISRSQENIEWLLRRHGKPAPAPLVIDMESYGSMVETHKADILKLYRALDHLDTIRAKKDIALEAIDPKPDMAILHCLETLVVKTGRYSKIIIVDAPAKQEIDSITTTVTETKSQDFGEAVRAAISGFDADFDGNVDAAWKEIEENSETDPVEAETRQEEIPQDTVEDESSQLIYSHRMSPEETETLFANAIAEGESKKKITIGAAGTTDPVIDDNAKNPILGKKKKGSGYINQNPNLHRGPKRPNMRA